MSSHKRLYTRTATVWQQKQRWVCNTSTAYYPRSGTSSQKSWFTAAGGLPRILNSGHQTGHCNSVKHSALNLGSDPLA